MTTEPAGTGMALETLASRDDAASRRQATRGLPMPEALRRRYGGPLEIPLHTDRPTIIANFVSTIDGVVALGPDEERGGGVISGSFEPDRFVMALLRSAADVVLMGAGTIAGSSSDNWTAQHLAPDLAGSFREWRRDLGLAPHPTTVIVTGSGEVRLGRRGVDDPELPVVFATTTGGADRLRERQFPGHVSVEIAGSGDRLSPDDLTRFLDRYRGQVVLCEGGPHLLGGLVAANLVDELFLTVAPRVLGRDTDRLTLLEGFRLEPDQARRHELVSIKRAADYLFLHYRAAAATG